MPQVFPGEGQSSVCKECWSKLKPDIQFPEDSEVYLDELEVTAVIASICFDIVLKNDITVAVSEENAPETSCKPDTATQADEACPVEEQCVKSSTATANELVCRQEDDHQTVFSKASSKGQTGQSYETLQVANGSYCQASLHP